MSEKIEIEHAMSSLAMSLSNELEAEFAEKLKNDAIPLKRNTILTASSHDFNFITIHFIAPFLTSILASYAVSFIKSLVTKCDSMKSKELDELEITVIYEANRKGKDNRSFSIPSEASKAKEFFSQYNDEPTNQSHS